MQQVKVGQRWEKVERGGKVLRFTITNISKTPSLGAIRATAKRPNGVCFFPDVRDLAAERSGFRLVEEKLDGEVASK